MCQGEHVQPLAPHHLGRSEVPIIREDLHESAEVVTRNPQAGSGPNPPAERATRHANQFNTQRRVNSIQTTLGTVFFIHLSRVVRSEAVWKLVNSTLHSNKSEGDIQIEKWPIADLGMFSSPKYAAVISPQARVTLILVPQ